MFRKLMSSLLLLVLFCGFAYGEGYWELVVTEMAGGTYCLEVADDDWEETTADLTEEIFDPEIDEYFTINDGGNYEKVHVFMY